MKSSDAALAQAARNVVEHCLGIQAGEVVSIVMSGSALSDLTEAAVEATIMATKPIKRGSSESTV